jgi:HAD superfamily hydrolase (TIGR01509 family)
MDGVETAKQLGHAIAMARRSAGLTQQELCARAHLSYSTLAKIERGAIKTPSVFTVVAIAAATNTTVEKLAGNSQFTAEIAKKQYKIAKNGIEFVFFDVNGVLVRFFHRAFSALAHDANVSADVIESAFWRYNDAVNKNEMTLQQFEEKIAEQIGLKNFSWMQYYLNNVEPIEEMHECLRAVAENYRVGLITNSMPGFVENMIKKGLIPDLHYEAIIDSSRIGYVKPQQEIFDLAAQAAHMSPSKLLLIDDGRTNVTAAEALGWHVLWFDDFHPTESRSRIEQILE